MLQYINQKRAQSTLEYAVLIIVVIGALITIQVYIKRGVQGRLRSASDDIGDQFSPGNTNHIKTVVSKSKTKDTFATGVSNSVLQGDETTNTTEKTQIVNVDTEYWGTQQQTGSGGGTGPV
jgi:hypothetical protein